MKRRWILLVAAVAVAASLPGIRNQFVQDEQVVIARNALVHDLGNWREIVTSAYWPPDWEEDLYRPLTSLLLSAEYDLGEGNPVVFRVVSYLLYAACAAAFLLLASRLLPGPIAVGVALLFAAHPVHAEAVALGVSQNEIAVALAAVFMLMRYLDRRRGPSGTLGLGDWTLLGALYLFACLMKENALVLPGLLVGAEALLVAGPLPARAKRLAPGYALLAVLGVAVLLVRLAVLGQLDDPGRADALLGLSAGGRALTMLQVVPQWLRLLIWPAHLQADYSPQEITSSSGLGLAEAAGAALLGLAIIVGWVARRRAPVVTFGLLWAGIALLPVSNVLVATGVVLAERNLFLPSMGFLLAVGGLVGVVWRSDLVPRRAKEIAFGSLLLLLTALAVFRSAERQTAWSNPEVFARRSAIDAPRAWRAQGAYANVLYSLGRKEEAIGLYHQAIALAPHAQAWRVRNELAECYLEEGRYALAIEQLRQSQAAVPNRRQTLHYLILGYLALGDYPAGARLADSALALGGSPELFGALRAAADSAILEKAPAGSIRIEVQRSPP